MIAKIYDGAVKLGKLIDELGSIETVLQCELGKLVERHTAGQITARELDETLAMHKAAVELMRSNLQSASTSADELVSVIDQERQNLLQPHKKWPDR